DLQGENFNIDHIVVSPAGVFCIETKSRAKYALEDGKSNARVDFDGKMLNFPSHKETKPVEQVRRNAKWLKDWLAKASAERVDVRPVLALPGWWVENKTRSDVLLVSGKNIRGFLKNSTTGTPLNPEQMQRIVHQIEQRCRDVEPSGYPQKKISPFTAK
ncbi:MAG TPA: nuclease-related domain-containing protein, partial [Oxalicibacterium sp.]|uniref:nuclease-related domain-containing protein n=1 Tax=Oxalicibacterium sp. TaxID=2766525 RepID=UPI002C505706